ncbi:MAG: bifunctional 5,10-methylenetetrahydrofolate dehydrogenase/5,10-methenyltetrahydrofolate cyclohydrolase [Leuconostoc gelidum]|jgi:methylenetetrahydrofolate dehydrogenase (NADP+)/methenyltetrahydrofolate cyclohydrolase|uniref:bifunctional 5,10-methylenetetrahydrofolate dehydrogenase/5,10-methenyltetrahydrofolate cyclohydrolase n=1 Tax=Leuconostoc gelidum TaxID=1244 RepID=UPI0002191DA9|nr:bifunctional 5,10-methylenetetrahydrofolate dehydrogenase/5,10-methenyltetrahydrofolate cyclohydrolase [Leuconostoc gelidum]AFS39986.1 methenyltetrahydrofolate cyclohydrolase [Leuconostoc gelidum JB7]MBZ5992469.1 bifunctional 5,10-methylenetetrahydrofolate dehydrogenase/5,10-methenyltetrahydrofolate cyclohydrolase [Leuconostoc gelidum subsp. gelidum]MBZ6001700.1 bifunctional 5,10-methylenetetrahydrofolate dehydrogenase/5,10-methenyltetrahydrofolate cyclohydrolase [Leuconostoc gelidum subsp. g
MTEILDGAAVAKITNAKTAERVARLNKPVTLAVIYDPKNDGSRLYVGMKSKKAAALGITTLDIPTDENATTASVIKLVEELNADEHVTGILVQSPLAKGVKEREIFSAVAPHKDADGLGATVQGMLFGDALEDYTVAATPQGVMTLLHHYNIEMFRKSAVVIGRSQLFGRPMFALLTNADATVTLAHRYTPEAMLKAQLKAADIVVVGVGIPHFISGSDLKSGAVVVDVGMNYVNGKAVGDVDFESAQGVASYITPVPGGVGPMTIATLLENTVTLAEKY